MPIALTILLAAIIVLLAYASSRPDTFRIERSTHIAAPMLQVAELIDDFREWRKWSPWEQIDPTLQRSFSGPDTGVGAVYEWTGAGAEKGLIAIKLEFLRPWKAVNTAEFVMTPRDTGTDLSWAMFGPSPFMSRLMGVFLDFDRIVGKDFEKGLAALKQEAEKANRPGAAGA